MRRKAGTLVPLELAICEAAALLASRDTDEFHGYAIAKVLVDAADARSLTAYGTLYRALARLEKMGLVESRWEEPSAAARESRPARRLYRLTTAGETAIERSRRGEPAFNLADQPDDGLAPA